MPLLGYLKHANGTFVSWQRLVDEWPDAVVDVKKFASFGFDLELDSQQGVAYRGPSQRLCPDQIEWQLDTTRIGRNIAVWNRVGSTNDLAMRASTSLANDGLVVIAEEQSAGRGSRGRSWLAPRGSSILMSILIFPKGPLDDPSWLTALGAVSVSEVVTDLTGLDAHIKWPNDVRVHRRKIAGILVERGAGSVIGIGLNVNLNVEEFPSEMAESATSMSSLFGTTLDRSEVARALLQRLDFWYGQGRANGPGTLDIPLQNRSEHFGKMVEIETLSGSVVGRVEEIQVGRGIKLTLRDGSLEWIHCQHIRTLISAESL